jgi:WD40 repeat protein
LALSSIESNGINCLLEESFEGIMRGKLCPIEHHGPSVAVKFFGDDLLLVGRGPLVKVYNYKTGEVLVSRKIFKRNKIHGIAFQRETIAFYGARSFSILSLAQVIDGGDLLNHELMINDWIIAGEFCYKGWELFLLTAHNVILSIDTYSKTLQWEKSVFGEKSILYSGSIKVTSRYDVYINAGTVMGGVIIWDLYKEEIIHTLKGHEGSIFNVKTSANNKYIVSCSDDRSIKLWDFKTGDLKATAWGHTARIWNLKFVGDKGVVSVSEDLTARTWNITEDVQLVPNHTYELHSGRHIWGLDINRDGTFAATGGNDGRIRLIDISENKIEEETEKFNLREIVAQSGIEYAIQKNEIVKGFWELTCGLVLITSFGGIFIYKNGSWSFLRTESEFNNMTLTNGFTEQDIITFTSSKGDTLFLKFGKDGSIINEQETQTDVSKVTNALSTVEGENLYLLVESPNKQDKLTLYQFQSDLIVRKTIKLTKVPTFVTTCFEVTNKLVFMGFRLSSLGVYDLGTGEELKLIKKISLSDTVTSIKKLEEKDDQVLLAITNRDGLYLYMRYNKLTNEHEFVHINNIRKGFLEGSLHINSELIVYGFKSSWFYIYNESRDFEITYENCGGAHRIWKLFHDDQGYKFIYVRDGTLHIRSVPNSPVPLSLSEGTHGREIRDIAIRDGCPKLLHLTGAEDTTMKLSTIDKTTGDVKNYWTVRKHTSGLQKVKFLNEFIVASSSAREEFFLWKIDEGFEYPLISNIGTLAPSSSNPDLRIMDFHHQFVYQDNEAVGVVLANVYSDSTIKVFFFDFSASEFIPLLSGRYKTCCLWDIQILIHQNRVLILTGATDGHLALFDVTEEIQFPIVDSSLQFQKLDESKQLPRWSNIVQVHQNGIKDLQVFNTENGFLVATGGDDNALGLVRFTVGDEIESKVVAFEPSAASSTITAVSKISGDRIAVISVDQVTRLWSVAGGKLTQLDHHYTTVADTGSSDSVNVDGRDYVLIGGIGLSLWEVK